MALRRRETLTSQLLRALTDRITRGTLKPGDKMPSEQELIGEFGVSRTVVREAISSLRAAGLVSTQQGVGAFVMQPDRATPFRIDETNLGILKEVIAVLELRTGLEAEAAALAAERRTPQHLKTLRAALDQMAAAIEAEQDAVGPDLDFHRTIAEATGNSHFTHLFGYLGTLLIPRTRVQTFKLTGAARADYLRRVNREHEDIFSAIADGTPAAASTAMRRHLDNSRERLRQASEHGRPERVERP